MARVIPLGAELAGLRLAPAALSMGPSQLREILELATRPDILSFGVGMPATELLPLPQVARVAAELLGGRQAELQYGMPSSTLKDHIVELMAERGVRCRREQIFLTSGAQQAMDLLVRLLLEPGGSVLLEETTYEGIQLAVKPLSPKVIAIPTSGEAGIDVDAVEAQLEAGEQPAFLYLIPEGHNPLGGSLSAEKRRRLVALARRYRMPLLEDDTYGHLQYSSEPRPALRSLDEDWVLYLGSFSKTLAPALRVGWIVAPEALMPVLSTYKHASDIDSATLGQRFVGAFLASGAYAEHVQGLRREYRCRRDAMLEALERHLQGRAFWSQPVGGFFVWVELPPGTETLSLLRTAVETEKVAFAPGLAFATGGGRHADNCLRLSFANLRPEEIEEGIRRLARVVS